MPWAGEGDAAVIVAQCSGFSDYECVCLEAFGYGGVGCMDAPAAEHAAAEQWPEEWGQCSRSCGGGERTKGRDCGEPSYGGQYLRRLTGSNRRPDMSGPVPPTSYSI